MVNSKINRLRSPVSWIIHGVAKRFWTLVVFSFLNGVTSEVYFVDVGAQSSLVKNCNLKRKEQRKTRLQS